MSDLHNGNPLFTVPVQSVDAASQLIGRLFDTAHTDAVYSKPHTQGGTTIIVASEVTVGMGVGFGGGEGNNPDEESGGGGGGGGYASGRPVAVISVNAAGVQVQPIFDLTKIAIAALTALGAMAVVYQRISRAARELNGDLT